MASSSIVSPDEVGGRHLNVSQNTSQRADLQSSISVNRNRCTQFISGQEMVATSYTQQMEALTLEKLNHLTACDAW
jgi:hypothetical protein